MISLLAVIVGLAVLVAVPVAVVAAIRAAAGVTRALAPEDPERGTIDARLSRIEDAIDAMAVQIERLRTDGGDARYVATRGTPPRLAQPDDEPPDA
jgi:hypothetical protein